MKKQFCLCKHTVVNVVEEENKYITQIDRVLLLPQYYQWICLAAEGGAQDVFVESVAAFAQGEVSQCLPPTVGLLCGAVLGEGPQSDRAGAHLNNFLYFNGSILL